MVENTKNYKKITSKAYICRSVGSKYQHHKTVVPKTIIEQHKVGDKAILEWIPYGNDYIVKVIK